MPRSCGGCFGCIRLLWNGCPAARRGRGLPANEKIMTATRLDHTSPWVIDTRSLGRRPGTMKQLTLTVPAGAHTGTPVLEVPEGADITVRLRLEAVAEGVLVTGSASATAAGGCVRCLGDVTADLDVPVQELYAYPDSTTAATTQDDEIPRLDDDLIDLRQLVHDELVLAMPLAPLCTPDCAGLCPECGGRLDDLGPGHRHETLDSRWAALARFSAGSATSTETPDGGIIAESPVGTDSTDSTEEN